MQPANFNIVSELSNINTKNYTLSNLAAAKGIIYATVDKTPRAQPRRKKPIRAPPRRKKKQNYSKCNSISSKLADSPTSIPIINEQESWKSIVVNEQKSRKPAAPYPNRKRWKSEDIYLPSNFRKEHNCSHSSDLYKPFLPQKSGRKKFFTLSKKTKYINNDLTKLEILKNYWQLSSVSKECNFRNQLCIEKANEYDLQTSLYSGIDLSSKLDCDQSSIYYSSVSSQSQNDISSYVTLYSEVVLDSDLQSENDNKESCNNDYQKSNFLVSDISKSVTNVDSISTLQKPNVSEKISSSDVLKNFDDLMDEVSLLGKSHITKSYDSIDFNNLIEILDLPEVLQSKSCKSNMKEVAKNDNTTIFNWNKIKTVDLTVKCSEFINNISESGSLCVQSMQNSISCSIGDLGKKESHILNDCLSPLEITDIELKTSESLHSQSIQCSTAGYSSDSERKKPHAFGDNLNSLDATNCSGRFSELLRRQSVLDSITVCNNLEESLEPQTVNSSVISLDTTNCNEKISEQLSAQAAQGFITCFNNNPTERELLAFDANLNSPNTSDHNKKASKSLRSQFIQDSVACHNDPEERPEIKAFNDNLSSFDTTDYSSDISWNISELWDTMNSKPTTDKLIDKNKSLSHENLMNEQLRFMTSDKNRHSSILEGGSNLESILLEDSIKKKERTGSEPQLPDETCIKENSLFTKNKKAEPQIADNVLQVDLMKDENLLNKERSDLGTPQRMSKNEYQVNSSLEQIIQNSSSDVSLNSDVEKWQLAKPSNSSGTFANSSYDSTLLDALQKTTCPFDELTFLKAKMDTTKNVPNIYLDSTQSQCRNLTPVSRFEQFEWRPMSSSSLGLFQTSKASRQPLKPFLVNLCIEGHCFHLDPFLFEIYPNMTLLMLKMKVNSELAIKTCQQRWILGNIFADDDDATLLSYGVFPGSYVFLYVDSNSKEPNLSSFKSAKNITTIETEFQSSLSSQLASLKVKAGLSERRVKENEKNYFVPCHENITKEASSQNTKRCVISQDSLLSLRSRVKKTQIGTVAEPKPSSPSNNSNNIRNRKKMQCIDTRSKCKGNLPALREEDKSKPVIYSENHSLNSSEEAPKPNLQQACSLVAPVECKSLPEQQKIDIALDLKRYDNLPTEKKFESPMDLSMNKIELHSHPKVEISEQKIIEHGSLENGINYEKDLVKRRQNYERFLELENLDLVPNVDSFECPICLCFIPENRGAVLRDCLHTFCKDCLSSVIVHSCESTIKCPYRDNAYSCSIYLQQREIKAVVSPEVYEQYLQRSLTAAESIAEKSFHCKSPDCLGWCLIEDNVNIFHCPVCSHYNCLTCQAIHEGLNCRQYQDNLKQQAIIDKDAEETLQLLAKMVRDGQAMKCPKCCVVLMKKWGCDWLKCSVCQTEVCWITKGPRWGPEGRGDISAGCKCGVNGMKCHPSCTYCH